jgi:hypothetical protein
LERIRINGVSACLSAEECVPHRRRIQKGSFGSHFDELVVQFPLAAQVDDKPSGRSRELQEKIDIHARLFQRAWRLDED